MYTIIMSIKTLEQNLERVKSRNKKEEDDLQKEIDALSESEKEPATKADILHLQKQIDELKNKDTSYSISPFTFKRSTTFDCDNVTGVVKMV